MEKNDIRLSIIIPHYNSTATIGRLLDSIDRSMQGLTVEITIVDDGSRDEERKELFDIAGRYEGVRVLENTAPVRGAGACRNIGLHASSGDWLLFADADDYFTEGAFLQIRQRLEEAAADTDIIFFRPDSLDLSTGERSDRHRLYEGLLEQYLAKRSHKEELRLRYLFVPPWSKLIRHELVKANDIAFETTPVSNDVMFAVKCARYARRIEACDDCIYIVTRSPGTLMTKKDVSLFRIREEVQLGVCSYVRSSLSADDYALIGYSPAPWMKIALRNYGIIEALRTLRLFLHGL